MESIDMQALDAIGDDIEQAQALVQVLLGATDAPQSPLGPVLHCLAGILTRAGATLDTFPPSALNLQGEATYG